MNNRHLRCSKDTFIVTTDPSFFHLEGACLGFCVNAFSQK